MIISRYLTKEVLLTLLGMTFVLLLIFLSHELVRFLGLVAAGKIALNILLQLLGLQIPYLLALLLPLGLYLGIVVTYGRMYAECELRVLHACGVSLGRLITITSFLTFSIMVIVLVLSLWVNPWIITQKDKLITRCVATNNILDTLMPGRFRVINGGKQVIYVEHISRNHKRADNIFMADQGKQKEGSAGSWSIVSAANGSKMIDPQTQDPFIVANGGFRYEGKPGQNDFKTIQFKKYAMRWNKD